MSRRALIPAAGVALLVAISVVATARAMPDIVTSSDLAVTELYTELATRGQLLSGPYSRFGWNHPGPMYFYVLAPFYALSEHRAAALFAVAVAINLGAVLAIAWVVSRFERGPLLVMVLLSVLLFAWRMPRLLASPWTAHIPVIASLAFVVACGVVLGGRHRLLPLVILLGSFITQTHLAYVPLAGVLAAVCMLAVIVEHRRRAIGVIGLSAALGLLLWLPTFTEAALNRGGNLAGLWRFFIAEAAAGQSASASIAAWSYALTGILRADLALPWGGHLMMEPARWMLPFAIAEMAGLALVSLWHLRSRRRLEAGVGMCAFLGSLIELWAMTRIRGEIVDHELIGIVALGALNLAILVSAALRWFWMRSWRWHEQTAVALSGAMLIAFAAVAVDHFRTFTSFEIRRSDTVRIPATYRLLRGFFEQRGIERPLFHLHGDAATDGVAIILRMMRAGWPVAVQEVATSVFPPGFAPSGREDALVNFSAGEGMHLELAARPGNVVLRDRHPLYVDVVPLPAARAARAITRNPRR